MSYTNWFSKHPVKVAFDVEGPITIISQTVLALHTEAAIAPTTVDDSGRKTITGPLMVGTRGGVYVTILPIVVVDAPEVQGVVLGQDWLTVTSARVENGIAEDWGTSWAEGDCAWFSCGYYSDEDNPAPRELWEWGCWAINRMSDTALKYLDRAWYHCGPASSSFAIGKPEQQIMRHLASSSASVFRRRRATAADIPQELFDIIIWYTDTEDNGKTIYHHVLQRRPFELSRCALVCVHWAEVSRKLMYDGPACDVAVPSLSALRGLADSARRGSQRLTPVDQLVRWMRARQRWKSRSWIHHVYLSPFDHDKNELWLLGPVPDNLAASALRSPHWSLPKTLPSCFLNFSSLDLNDVHFPALSDFAKLIQHFVRTENFFFLRVTWDVSDVIIPSRSRSHCLHLDINPSRCTDDWMIHAQTRLMLDKANIPYYHLPAPEQDACLQVLAAFRECTDSSRHDKETWLLSHFRWPSADPVTRLEDDVASVFRSGDPVFDFRWEVCKGLTLFVSFLCDWALGAPVVKAISFLLWTNKNMSCAQLTKYYAMLHAELQTGLFPSLAILSLEFPVFALLQDTLNVFPDLRTFRSADRREVAYQLLCPRDGLKDHPQFLDVLPKEKPESCNKSHWAVIDPESMQPTGKTYGPLYTDIMKELRSQAQPVQDT